jgi:hypothetical protein
LINWSIFLDPLSTLRRAHDPSPGGVLLLILF